jgi:hypothetical protein
VSRLVLLASLTLGVLAVVHLAGTLLSACWPVRRRRSPEACARLALALRLGPFLVASVVASVVALAFARNEPAGTQEHASSILLAAAAVGAWLLVTGAWRAARSLVLTRRLLR